MKNLLLPDADVIVDLHKLGYWKGVIANYSLQVSSVVVKEVKFYDDPKGGRRKEIDLKSYIDKEEMIQISATPEEISEVLKKLDKAKLGTGKLDPGELECITIMDTNKIPGLMFCVIETAAVKAVCYLGLDDKTISVEEVLKNVGIIKVKDIIPYKYPKARLQKIITEGKFFAIEVEKLTES